MDSFFEGKKVLITGGSGFVGRHLVSRLLELKSRIYVTDKVNLFAHQPEVTFFNLDVVKYNEVKSVIHSVRPNFIFHLAAIVTAAREFNLIDEMIEVNLRGSTNILRAIDGLNDLECMINFGTCEEYGNQERQFDEVLREEPASPYAILKLTTSRFCNMFSGMFKIPIITIRPANLFGPGQAKDKFIPYTILKCLKNDPIDMTYGEQKRNFIYIDDFINGVLLIAEKERKLAQIYNIGSESSVSLRSVVELIKQMLDSQSVINFGALNYRENEMMAFDVNIQKIINLGWKPEYTLLLGLKRTAQFYQSMGVE
ncbi:MAG TPA: NAD(P)-dependent oxidoreductase [Bacillota bacterium]|nr:NAD(P)-dependent oxidoreductase [Bacillota bacterium]